jgi:hypothetical protein
MLLLLFAACAPPLLPDVLGDPVVDARVDVADVPLATGDVLLEGPDHVLEPGDDRMTCLFGTWTGGDVGLHAVRTWQSAGGHHFQLLGTTVPELDAPDGTVVDCTGEGGSFSMGDLTPLIIAEQATVDGVPSALGAGLPAGMAVELEADQRYVLQSHYINYGEDAIRVRDLAVLSTVTTDAVVTWAAPLVLSRQDFSLPPGEASTTSFECALDQEWTLHSLFGHMHEWGSAFAVERYEGDVPTPFYAVDEWDPAYRDQPVVSAWEDGAMVLPAGTRLRTTCDWFNDTEAALVFPHEMCVAIGLVYPQKGTVICNGDAR